MKSNFCLQSLVLLVFICKSATSQVPPSTNVDSINYDKVNGSEILYSSENTKTLSDIEGDNTPHIISVSSNLYEGIKNWLGSESEQVLYEFLEKQPGIELQEIRSFRKSYEEDFGDQNNFNKSSSNPGEECNCKAIMPGGSFANSKSDEAYHRKFHDFDVSSTNLILGPISGVMNPSTFDSRGCFSDVINIPTNSVSGAWPFTSGQKLFIQVTFANSQVRGRNILVQ